MSKIKSLKKIKLFQVFAESTLEEIAAALAEESFKKGDFIIRRNEPGKNMYFITSGKVRIRVLDKQDIILDEGNFFGEMALISGAPRAADVIAETDVKVLTLSRLYFETELSSQPVFSRLLTQVFADRLGSLDGSLEDKQLGEFRLSHEIGRGEMGIIYYGSHMTLKKPVAVKMLSHRFVFDAGGLKRFLNEAKAIARLSHNYIRSMLDIEQAYGTYFIVMEYVEGLSLNEIKSRDSKLSHNAVREILIQLAEGLNFAHSRSVIHKALKPGNVLINTQGEVKITDFGLAYTSKENLSKIDDLSFGTPYFVSPEQIKGESLDHLTDIYSYGVIAYYLLTGKYPFEGPDTLTVLSRHLNDDYIPPVELEPDTPMDLQILIKRCLVKDKFTRLQSLHDMRSRLHIWSFGEEIGDSVHEVLQRLEITDTCTKSKELLAKVVSRIFNNENPEPLQESIVIRTPEPFEMKDEEKIFELDIRLEEKPQLKEEVAEDNAIHILERNRQELMLVKTINSVLKSVSDIRRLQEFFTNLMTRLLKEESWAFFLNSQMGFSPLNNGKEYTLTTSEEEAFIKNSAPGFNLFRANNLLTLKVISPRGENFILFVTSLDKKNRVYSPENLFGALALTCLAK